MTDALKYNVKDIMRCVVLFYRLCLDDESKSTSNKTGSGLFGDDDAEWRGHISELVRKGRYPSSFRMGGLRLLSMRAEPRGASSCAHATAAPMMTSAPRESMAARGLAKRGTQSESQTLLAAAH